MLFLLFFFLSTSFSDNVFEYSDPTMTQITKCYAVNEESITIPDKVTDIGLKVFEGCRATLLTFSEYSSIVSFLDGVFESTNFVTINLPRLNVPVPRFSFRFSSKLENVLLPQNFSTFAKACSIHARS